jgi:hypothetical protein
MIPDDELRRIQALFDGERAAGAGEETPGELERAWRSLELPPPAPAPPGFARRVAARAEAERRAAFGLPLAPRLARLAAAAAAAAGVAAGAGLGLTTGAEAPAADEGDDAVWASTTFAEELFDGLAAAVDGDDEGSAR